VKFGRTQPPSCDRGCERHNYISILPQIHCLSFLAIGFFDPAVQCQECPNVSYIANLPNMCWIVVVLQIRSREHGRYDGGSQRYFALTVLQAVRIASGLSRDLSLALPVTSGSELPCVWKSQSNEAVQIPCVNAYQISNSAAATVASRCRCKVHLHGHHNTVKVASSEDNSSVHTTPSLRGLAQNPVVGKTDIDNHFRLEPQSSERQDKPSSASAESPPPFSSHNFPSRYFPAPSPVDPYRALVPECATPESLTATALPSGPAPPFEESTAASSVVAETKAALPRDTKDGRSSKDLDDGEPPPPYTEGSSPLDGFTYVMSAAGGAASIITQVQQGGPAPINTALGCEWRSRLAGLQRSMLILQSVR